MWGSKFLSVSFYRKTPKPANTHSFQSRLLFFIICCGFCFLHVSSRGLHPSPRRAEHLLRKLLRALPKSRTLSPLSKPQHGYVANLRALINSVSFAGFFFRPAVGWVRNEIFGLVICWVQKRFNLRTKMLLFFHKLLGRSIRIILEFENLKHPFLRLYLLLSIEGKVIAHLTYFPPVPLFLHGNVSMSAILQLRPQLMCLQ